MPTAVPEMSLSHGQVLWALARGRQPEATMVDEVRYLRQLGVPFRPAELGRGRGNRLRYRYEHLIELGVALFALRRGMRPREIATLLVGNRKRLREIYRKAWSEQPEAAVASEWVKSRGRIVPVLANEIVLRLHDRYSSAPGTIELLGQKDQIRDLSQLLVPVETYPGEEARTLLPLTRLALELAAWAQEAPELKPGP
jgi:hypothetical protein